MGDAVLVTAPGGARWRASLWDYVAIVGWLAVVTILGVGVRSLAGSMPAATPVTADALALLLTVLPVWVSLTLGEGGRRGAGLGKRRAGLRVMGSGGDPPGYGRAAARNAVKLLPWQLAHVAVVRLVLGVDAPVTIGVAYTLSLVIPVVSIAMAWRDPLRRALHDRVAGTRVVTA